MLVARVTIGPGRWSKRGRRRVWEAKGVQPVTFNVAYFLLLKRKYSNAILGLARNYTYYISKKTFLLAFKTAFK